MLTVKINELLDFAQSCGMSRDDMKKSLLQVMAERKLDRKTYTVSPLYALVKDKKDADAPESDDDRFPIKREEFLIGSHKDSSLTFEEMDSNQFYVSEKIDSFVNSIVFEEKCADATFAKLIVGVCCLITVETTPFEIATKKVNIFVNSMEQDHYKIDSLLNIK